MSHDPARKEAYGDIYGLNLFDREGECKKCHLEQQKLNRVGHCKPCQDTLDEAQGLERP